MPGPSIHGRTCKAKLKAEAPSRGIGIAQIAKPAPEGPVVAQVEDGAKSFCGIKLQLESGLQQYLSRIFDLPVLFDQNADAAP